jgi:hypothetical protein
MHASFLKPIDANGRVSKLNKKLALLKQQHQRLKLRLQSAKEEAYNKAAADKGDASSDPSEMDSISPLSSLQRRGEHSSPS